MPVELDGACFCGAITWEATVDENVVGTCHCRDCQFDQLRPTVELFCDSKVPWLAPVEGAQPFPGMPV